MSPAAAAVRVLVSGRVQGVGFRWSAVDQGARLGLAGWARNLVDGRVEVYAQGDPEALARLVDWLHRGPPRAEVTAVVAEPAAPQAGLEGFHLRA